MGKRVTKKQLENKLKELNKKINLGNHKLEINRRYGRNYIDVVNKKRPHQSVGDPIASGTTGEIMKHLLTIERTNAAKSRFKRRRR